MAGASPSDMPASPRGRPTSASVTFASSLLAGASGSSSSRLDATSTLAPGRYTASVVVITDKEKRITQSPLVFS